MPRADQQAAGSADDAARPSRLHPALRPTLAAVVVSLVAGASAIPWWFSNPTRLGRLVARIVPELDADVTFEKVRLGWTGPMVLEGVRVIPRDGGPAPITIDRVEGSHGLLAILLSAGDLGRLVVERPTIDLAFDENHRSNLEKLTSRPPTGEPRPEPRTRRSAVRTRLAIRDAVLRITAPWTSEPWISEPISAQAALAPTAGGFSEWVVEPVKLLTDARMEPAVAWGVLAYVAPVLADAARTSGRFSVSLDEARLPVGDPAAGTLSGALLMHEVTVGPGPLVGQLLRTLPGGLAAPPAIRVADESHVRFRLADRRVSHEGLEFGLPLPGPGRRIDVQSSGTVGLADGSLDLRLALPIPDDLGGDRAILQALAGKTVSLGVTGRLGEPQVVFDGSIRRMVTDVARDIVNEAAGESADRPATGSTGEVVADVVGDMIEAIARRRAARRAEAGADQDPPRLERPRTRVRRPAAPAPVEER